MKTKIRRGLAMLTILALIMQFTVNLQSIAVFAADTQSTAAVEEIEPQNEIVNETKEEVKESENSGSGEEKKESAAESGSNETPAAASENKEAVKAPETEKKETASEKSESNAEVKETASEKSESKAESRETASEKGESKAEVKESAAEESREESKEAPAVENESKAEIKETPAENNSIEAAQNTENESKKTAESSAENKEETLNERSSENVKAEAVKEEAAANNQAEAVKEEAVVNNQAEAVKEEAAANAQTEIAKEESAVKGQAEAVKEESAEKALNENADEELNEDAEEAEEETAEPEEEKAKGPVSAASLAATANAGTEPREDNKITVHYTYGLSALAKYRVDGKVTPYEYTLTMTKGQTKTQTASGTLSYFGGKNYSFSDSGVKYTFQNTFVESCALDNSGDITPVFTDATDENGNPLVTESTMITKVANKGNGVVVLTYADGHTKELSNIADLYLSPVYAKKEAWFLDHRYIDNISTGSGSWKNNDFVTSYSHKFTNPEVKSPNLTAGKYRFEYWMTDETGEKYKAGDTFKYTGEGQAEGTTKLVETFAYWQPAIAVKYIVEGSVAATAKSFDEDISVEEAFSSEGLSDDDYRFDGWYEGAEKAQDTYRLPEITKEAGTYEEHEITAFWQPAVAVAYHVLNTVETVKDFAGISVYDRSAEGDDTVSFEGWYDAEGNRIDEDRILDAPAITSEKEGAALYDVFARFATSRAVRKVWEDEDNADGIRAEEVTVQLYANGEPTGRTIVLNDANSWSAVFENLDAHDAEGNLIEYSISEDMIPEGYSAMITVDGTEFTVINTHEVIPAAEPEDDEQTPAAEPEKEDKTPDAEEPAEEENRDEKPAAVTEDSDNTPAGPAAPEKAAETKEAADTQNEEVIPAEAAVTEAQAEKNTAKTVKTAAATVNEAEEDAAPSQRAAGRARATAVPAAVIEGNAVPAAVTEMSGSTAEAVEIADNAAPLAAPAGSWALINLIAMVLTTLGAVLAVLRRKEDDEENEDENNGKGSMRMAKLAGLIAAIVSIAAFILTEDMTQQMILTDGWTVLMIIILAVQAVSAALVKKASENEDENESSEMGFQA